MPILIDYTVAPQTFTYASTPSITAAGGYGKFTTNPGGVFGGFLDLYIPEMAGSLRETM